LFDGDDGKNEYGRFPSNDISSLLPVNRITKEKEPPTEAGQTSVSMRGINYFVGLWSAGASVFEPTPPAGLMM
jgi:hypothetical protein